MFQQKHGWTGQKPGFTVPSMKSDKPQNCGSLYIRIFTAIRIFIPTYLTLIILAIGCHSSPPKSPASSVVLLYPQVGSRTLFWPFRIAPSDLPIFGSPTTNSIRVAVFGMGKTVKRPGYYYLPSDAVVRDAVEAAQGVDDFTSWNGYSGIERPQPDGTLEVIRYTRDMMANEQIPLKDGDSLFFGHEVY
jgi:hypothetical protein